MLIQGYAATVTNRGKLRYAKFAGGFTKNFDEAEVVETIKEAYELARRRIKQLPNPTIYDVPGVVAIDEYAQPQNI